MENKSEIDYLREKMKNIDNYPEGIEQIEYKNEAYINGISFFPGGRGLFIDGDETISNKDIMIIGQDFDTKENFLKARAVGKEDVEKNRTWKTLLKLLQGCKVNENKCFFTNIIVGLRKGTKNTGKSIAFKNKGFLKKNSAFFKEQLICQKPKNILLLGYYPAFFLADTILPDKLESWRTYKTLSAFYKNKNSLKKNVLFDFDGNKFSANILVIPHPSMLNSNLKYVYHEKLNSKESLQFLFEKWAG